MYEKLKSRREELGINQEAIARALGFAGKNAYSLKERGLRKFSVDEAKKISEILKTPIEQLFFANEDDKTSTE